jgi:hypothetical protein
MRPNDPFSLILAPDHRFELSGCDQDITWEVQLDGGEFGGLSIYSTLALSASSLRIFPVFSNKSETRTKLSQFSSPLSILKITPNYARFQMEVFDGITASLDLWVKDSHLLLGRIILNNSSAKKFSGTVAWVVQDAAISAESNMTFSTDFKNPILHGKIQDQHMVFLSNGAPVSGKIGQISLENTFALLPGAQQMFQWAFCMDEKLENALELANQGINANWEAETARIEIINQKDFFEFETGNQNWDHVLEMSQVAAHQLIVHNWNQEDHHILLKSRNPEQKISLRQSPKEMNDQAVLQNPLELWRFLQVLPGCADLVLEQISCLLQDSEEIQIQNNAPPINLLKTQQLPFPMLAQILWEAAQLLPGHEAIKENFPKILLYLHAWQNKIHSENTENLPCWANALQTLYDYLPIHDRWHSDSEGIDTRWILSPMLLSLLLNEVSKTIQLAELLDFAGEIEWLEGFRGFLLKAIHSCWNPKKHLYSYLDVISKTSYAGYLIHSMAGSGDISLKRTLRRGQRLTIKISSQQEHTRHIRITISGESNSNQVTEEIHPRDIHWYGGSGTYTTKWIYSRIHQVCVGNCPPEDTVSIFSSDYSRQDLSLYLSIWAGVCDSKRVKYLWEKSILPEYLQPFGLSMVPLTEQPAKTDAFNVVDLTMNCLMTHGLLQYGYEEAAKTIWTNNLFAITKNLKLFKRFLKQYDASDGYGTGNYNIINGIPSITLFLNLAGIERWSKTEVVINRLSVFENPVVIRYRGNLIKTTSIGHEFTSPGGGKIITTGKGPHRIIIPE